LIAMLGPAQLSGQPTGDCTVDDQSDWDVRVVQGHARSVVDLAIQFGRGRFIGYAVGGVALPLKPGATVPEVTVETADGLRLRDTIARARQLYGGALQTSAAQGGSYVIQVPHGRIDGYASGRASPGHIVAAHSTIRTIQAGDNGCPAQSP
jgi:hypothetical protein